MKLDFQTKQLEMQAKNLTKLVEDHKSQIYGDEHRQGLLVRVDRLEQVETARRWHLRAIWTALLAAVVSAVLAMISAVMSQVQNK